RHTHPGKMEILSAVVTGNAAIPKCVIPDSGAISKYVSPTQEVIQAAYRDADQAAMPKSPGC
ncbi:hypothetical protein M5Z86_11110, partial [Neisseria meningitidis]|nr:hypothetical protein [Neisseria meningitidis]